MDPGLAALWGAALGGVIAVSMQVIQFWATARTRHREARKARLVDYLSGTYAAVLAISEVARAPLEQRPQLEREGVRPLLDRVNTALTGIQLQEPPSLRRVTEDVDAAVMRLANESRGFEGTRADWTVLRSEIIDGPVAVMKAASRREIGNRDWFRSLTGQARERRHSSALVTATSERPEESGALSNSPAEIRLRLQEQARGHWLEFGVIVASANVLLALGLFGRAITQADGLVTKIAAGAIVIASIMAAMLAYYSLQVGAVLVAGATRLLDVALSFLIAATQLALFLWPIYILGDARDVLSELDGLRHWMLFYGGFALAAGVAIWYNGRLRRASGVAAEFPKYELAQRQDGVAAAVAGFTVLLCWVISFSFEFGALLVGVLISIIASVQGMLSQARTLAGLHADVRL